MGKFQNLYENLAEATDKANIPFDLRTAYYDLSDASWQLEELVDGDKSIDKDVLKEVKNVDKAILKLRGKLSKAYNM